MERGGVACWRPGNWGSSRRALSRFVAEAQPGRWQLVAEVGAGSGVGAGHAVLAAPPARVGNQATIEQTCRKLNVPRPNLSGQVPRGRIGTPHPEGSNFSFSSSGMKHACFVMCSCQLL